MCVCVCVCVVDFFGDDATKCFCLCIYLLHLRTRFVLFHAIIFCFLNDFIVAVVVVV